MSHLNVVFPNEKYIHWEYILERIFIQFLLAWPNSAA